MTESLKEAVSSVWTDVKRGLSSAPPNDAYLAWDASGVESIKPDEQEKTQRIKEVMERMQKRNFDLHRKAFRATHVKTQGIVKGKLQVHPDLPEHLRQGIFAEPDKTYDVAARYANEPYILQRDQESGPRGLGLKVFGVTGPRLEDVDGSVNTQDFFFNNAPSIELTDVDTTLDIMSLREKYFDDPAALGRHLKMRTDLVKQHAPYLLPNSNIISHAMYTQSAFRFGQYYGHMALFPVLEPQKIADDKVKNDDPSCVLSDWLFDYFGGKEARYEFKVRSPSCCVSPVYSQDADSARDRPSSSSYRGRKRSMGRGNKSLSILGHYHVSCARQLQSRKTSVLGGQDVVGRMERSGCA
jgi:hypothetical protein